MKKLWLEISKIQKLQILFLISFFISIFYIIYIAYIFAPGKFLKIKFLDVGQGDSIFLETPSHKKVLIDTGKDGAVLSKLGEILPNINNEFEIIIATHDDADHIGALPLILEKYKVKILLISLSESVNPLWQEVLRVAKEKNVQIKNIEQVGEINFNDGVKIKILFPIKNMNGIENGNDASIVTQVIHGRNKVLLTGDLPQTGELFLISLYGENLKSDILKLGHHGSDTSTHVEFLAKVKPQVGVVSAGKDNTFGHPHRSVIELLEKFKIDVLETAKEGNINFESDGINMWRE